MEDIKITVNTKKRTNLHRSETTKNIIATKIANIINEKGYYPKGNEILEQLLPEHPDLKLWLVYKLMKQLK